MRRTFVLSVAAALVASIILAVSGVVLSSIYHNAVERSFDRRLGVYLGALIADVAAPEQSSDRGKPTLGDPSFDFPLSGWYWQITGLDVAKPEVRSSRSLWDTTLTRLRDEDATTSADGARHGYAIGPERQRLRLIERTVDLGEDGRYLIVVAGDPQEIDDEMRSFHKAIVISFGFLAALLALMMFFQTRLVSSLASQ
jgi:hypothetical protein